MTQNNVKQKVLLILSLLTSLCVSFININTFSITSKSPSLMMMGDVDENGGKNKKLGKSRFDRMIDDFVNKRYGGGEAFYGKRLSTLSEEDYQKEMLKRSQSDTSVEQKSMLNKEFKNNAILVVGNPSSDVLQWSVFDLLEKGFAVRLAFLDCDRKGAVRIFGLPVN